MFSILHIHGRSFIHGIDDVILLLDSIETQLSIIVITETWLQSTIQILIKCTIIMLLIQR